MNRQLQIAHLRRIGQLGGRARYVKYGNPGTSEGRRRGGLTSLITHARLRDGFQVARRILRPRLSSQLAEAMGIMIGDGHLSQYQATVATSIKTDFQHLLFAQSLFAKLFGILGTIQKRPEHGVAVLVLSSKNVVQYISRMGMPVGNKIKKNVQIPSWIIQRSSWQKAFIRGLFDTDGCVYSDKHTYKGKTYHYPSLNITSYSPALIRGTLSVLRNCGFAPTNSQGNHGVFLRRRSDVEKYFRVIGSSNEKHSMRYKRFIGGVPKRS